MIVPKVESQPHFDQATIDQNSMVDRFYQVRKPGLWGSWLASIWAVFHPYVVIATAIYAAEILADRNIFVVSIAIFLISSRQASLYLAGHEGVHGLLIPPADTSQVSEPKFSSLRRAQLNDFIARWLCLFPLGISFSRYRLHHQLHHALLGTPGDPDQKLYNAYPRPWSSTIAFYFKEMLSGRVILGFLRYYNELLNPDAWRFQRADSDHGSLAVGWLVGLTLLIATGGWELFLIYWALPWLMGMPLHHFMGALQHGSLHLNPSMNLRARSLDGPNWSLELLFPLNIRFHAEHHLAPSIPYRLLPHFSQWLDAQRLQRTHQSLGSSLRDLHRDPRASE